MTLIGYEWMPSRHVSRRLRISRQEEIDASIAAKARLRASL
jgi:hypothetical protein